MKAYTTVSTRETPQSEPIPGKEMVRNTAGGFGFQVDDWHRLDRFLVLGNEGGTYYASERKLTRENADCVLRCIKADGVHVVGRIVDWSYSGRAPKNDPALFALAMCAGLGDEETRKVALQSLPIVARIGTHLFHFAAYVEQFRGWGRALSSAIKRWYVEQSVDDLAYQAVKYQSRDGWSHRDLLRLSHPKSDDLYRNTLYKWIVSGAVVVPVHRLIEGFEMAKASPKPDADLIVRYGLTREMIPTDWLGDAAVWEALLEKMPLTAMIRNLGKMTNVGLLKPMSQAAAKVKQSLSNVDALRKARIHPIAILTAIKIYEQGHGDRGSLSWDPLAEIIDALDAAFYLSFNTIQRTNKRWLLGLDVSASMASGDIAGTPLRPREASAAMALVTANTEPQHHIMGFCSAFTPLGISPRQRLSDAIDAAYRSTWGATNCALPMLWAAQSKVEVDAFVVYTDCETWSGKVHPCQALNQYRQKMGIGAKLIVVGMTATEFTIADPDDAGMMDVVGFDTVAPAIISDFVGPK